MIRILLNLFIIEKMFFTARITAVVLPAAEHPSSQPLQPPSYIAPILKKKYKQIFYTLQDMFNKKPSITFYNEFFSCVEKSQKKHLFFSLLQWCYPLIERQ